MGVMGVQQSWAAELLQYGRDGSRVQSCAPDGRVDSNPGGAEPLRQLAAPGGNYDLIETEGVELAGEEPHLPLAASPLTP